MPIGHGTEEVILTDLIDSVPTSVLLKGAGSWDCTGIGARDLGDVRDPTVYPVRGQIVLVENPRIPVTRQYVRVSPQAENGGATYVFPRGLHGGIVLGGCRQEHNWDGQVDFDLAKDIMERCCKLAPELGRPEDLRVIHHGVGLRRELYPRLNGEMIVTITSISEERRPYRKGGNPPKDRNSQLWCGRFWISVIMVSLGRRTSYLGPDKHATSHTDRSSRGAAKQAVDLLSDSSHL